jgi:hypothetical protein
VAGNVSDSERNERQRRAFSDAVGALLEGLLGLDRASILRLMPGMTAFRLNDALRRLGDPDPEAITPEWAETLGPHGSAPLHFVLAVGDRQGILDRLLEYALESPDETGVAERALATVGGVPLLSELSAGVQSPLSNPRILALALRAPALLDRPILSHSALLGKEMADHVESVWSAFADYRDILGLTGVPPCPDRLLADERVARHLDEKGYSLAHNLARKGWTTTIPEVLALPTQEHGFTVAHFIANRWVLRDEAPPEEVLDRLCSTETGSLVTKGHSLSVAHILARAGHAVSNRALWGLGERNDDPEKMPATVFSDMVRWALERMDLEVPDAPGNARLEWLVRENPAGVLESLELGRTGKLGHRWTEEDLSENAVHARERALRAAAAAALVPQDSPDGMEVIL